MHDVYGTPINTEVTETTVTYYYLHNNQLVIGEYNRRTTQTTYSTHNLPSSLS